MTYKFNHNAGGHHEQKDRYVSIHPCRDGGSGRSLIDCVIERAVLDKRVTVGPNCWIGGGVATADINIAIVGKNSAVPEGCVIEPNGGVGTDVAISDYDEKHIHAGQFIQTRRLPNEL